MAKALHRGSGEQGELRSGRTCSEHRAPPLFLMVIEKSPEAVLLPALPLPEGPAAAAALTL